MVINSFPQASSAASPASTINPVLNNGTTYAKKQGDNSTDPGLEFIANDLVKALTFIAGMEPEFMAIATSASASLFDKHVKNSMVEQGYRFSDRAFQSGVQLLTTSYTKSKTERQPENLTAIMAINGVLIKRTYLIRNNSVEPDSAYIIRGVSSEFIDANKEQIRTI